MKRFYLAAMISAAALVACTSRESTFQPLSDTSRATPTPTTLAGRIVADPAQDKTTQLLLVQEDGTILALAGAQTAWLASVIGADVETTGLIDYFGLMDVDSFIVLAVQGLRARDGILELGDSYALRSTLDGKRYEIVDPPEELKSLVGRRVWITGPDDAAPTAFGAIVDVSKVTDANRARWQPSARR